VRRLPGANQSLPQAGGDVRGSRWVAQDAERWLAGDEERRRVLVGDHAEGRREAAEQRRMPEALTGLEGVHDPILVNQVHGPRVDDVHALGRLAVLHEGGRALRQGDELRGFGGRTPLVRVHRIERRLMREELCELVGGVQDSVTR